MAAYSLDLRERILDALERNYKSKPEIAKLFGVHQSFIYKLLPQMRQLDHIAPLPHRGRATAILTQVHVAKLAQLVALTPAPTLVVLRQHIKKQARLDLSPSTICRGLQALGLSRKTSRNLPPKLTLKRVRRSANNRNS
jgi:transposase